jgi:hypothetical protein
MSNNLVKNFYVLSGFPEDLEDGFVDVLVTLTDDNEYFVEIATPKALSTYMDEKKRNFFEPEFPLLFVRKLTPEIIRETLEEFASKQEDTFWLKLYHLTVELTIDDLNDLMIRYEKRMAAENEVE